MPKELANRKPTTRRYLEEEKAAVVRMVRTLRSELGTAQGTVQRVASQLDYGVESVRMWVKQADIDDGVSRLFAVEGVAVWWLGVGRGPLMMEVPTPSIERTSTCVTLPSLTLT